MVDPEHIAISKSKGIEIDWKDGQHSSFGLAFLRDNCPCAVCTGAHGTVPQRTNYQAELKNEAPAGNPFQMYKPAVKMLSIEPVGQYAIKIHWNDGHATGIYSWEHLRKLAEEAGHLSPIGKA